MELMAEKKWVEHLSNSHYRKILHSIPPWNVAFLLRLSVFPIALKKHGFTKMGISPLIMVRF